MRAIIVLLAALFLAAAGCEADVAAAAPSVHMMAGLTPEQLGRPASIKLSLDIAGVQGRLPPAPRQVDVRYPSKFGIALSGLGLETCTAQVLEALGPPGCPADSVMGKGTALGEIPFGPETIKEPASVTIVRAESQNGHVAMLMDAQGISPVVANIVFPAVLLPAPRPYGGDIRLDVPLVPSLPEAPDVAVTQLSATIGPAAGLLYQEDSGGRTSTYTPKGILLPSRCPRGGFPFTASVAFVSGGDANAGAHVQCPRRGGESHPGSHAPRR